MYIYMVSDRPAGEEQLTVEARGQLQARLGVKVQDAPHVEGCTARRAECGAGRHVDRVKTVSST
jgi:hypothetical protein